VKRLRNLRDLNGDALRTAFLYGFGLLGVVFAYFGLRLLIRGPRAIHRLGGVGLLVLGAFSFLFAAVAVLAM